MTLVTPDDILREHQLLHEHAIASGHRSPLIFPHHFLPVFILILTLLIPWPQIGFLSYTRYLSFAYIAYLTAGTVTQVQTLGLASGYGPGVILAWFLLWSATLLVFNNPQQEFSRIEKSGDVSVTSKIRLKGSASQPRRDSGLDVLNDTNDGNQSQETKEIAEGAEAPFFRWQPFPETILHRLFWVLDLVFNFRGPGWNWRISTLQPLPGHVRDQLKGELKSTKVLPNEFNLPAAKSTIRSLLRTVALGYLTLDIIKTILTNDPYYLGIIPSLSPYLSALDPESPLTSTLNLLLHQGVSLCAIIIAIRFVAATFWASFLGISILCSHFAGTRFAIPLEQPWMYPGLFGPFLSSILDRGLAGTWTPWWHQLFRFVYVSAGKWTISHLPANLQKKPNLTHPLRISIAFLLSGFLHSMGSYTQVSHTHPFSRSLLFFLLQAPGILLQTAVSKYVNEQFPVQIPRWLRRAGNLVFVVLWFCLTGPLEGDDLARCGIWLLEPVPFSLINALGYGDGKGSWRWTWNWVQVWRGEQWWDRGILIL